jgi:two-component system, cell cycle response regulator
MIPTPDAKKRVLIGEDDPISRRLLEVLLVKWGFEVELAATGLEALQVLERIDAPRLALLDWMMPGMEGTEVCRKLRELKDRAYVYVLLLSGRTQKEDLLQGLDSGADDYLTKPFDSQELRARLHVGRRILDLQDKLIATGEELLFRATHDNLTGISNRGVILDNLRRERARQERGGAAFAIVLADIDHFKYVNDTYGHLAGDAVLKEIASRMVTFIRPYDLVGRYGGEEFLILAPSSDSLGAITLAERIRNAIEEKPVIFDGKVISVTASFGIAVSTPSQRLDAQQMIRVADEALYTAKANGRNRCDLASIQILAPDPALSS